MVVNYGTTVYRGIPLYTMVYHGKAWYSIAPCSLGIFMHALLSHAYLCSSFNVLFSLAGGRQKYFLRVGILVHEVFFPVLLTH